MLRRSPGKLPLLLAIVLALVLFVQPTRQGAAQGAVVSKNAVTDLGMSNNGTNATGNLQKIILCMIDLYQNYGGGEIYFPAGTYAVDNQIRPLPNITFRGADPATTIIKNIYYSANGNNIYWNGSVIFAGHDQPMESGNFYHPFAATPQQGSNQVIVNQPDASTVALGEEIKLLSATYSCVPDRSERWPDRMLKAIVIDKDLVPGDQTKTILTLDRTLPWTLNSTGNCTWGTGPSYTGVPVWMRVQDWVDPNGPAYWSQAGNYGYTQYNNMGAKWGKGWSSRNNTFQNLTLWSMYSTTLYRGLPCDSLFDNCILKGRVCIYGNGMQYTNFTNCQFLFWDQCAEIAYNSYHCVFTLNKLVDNAVYVSTLKPADHPAGSLTNTMGMFSVHERSEKILVTGLVLKCAGRAFGTTEGSDNSMIRVCGDHNVFAHVALHCPDVPRAVITVSPQNLGNPNGTPPAPTTPPAQAPTDVHFYDFQVDMHNHGFSTFAAVGEGPTNVGFHGVQILNATSNTDMPGHMNLVNSVARPCSNLTYTDLGPLPGKFRINAPFTNIAINRCSSTTGGTEQPVSGPPNAYYGLEGTYKANATVLNSTLLPQYSIWTTWTPPSPW